MTLGWFVTVAGGVLAMVGVGGLFVSFVVRAEPLRSRGFRVGTVGLTLAGLVLLLGDLFVKSGTQAYLSGLLLIMLGTGISLAPRKPAKSAAPTEQPEA